MYVPQVMVSTLRKAIRNGRRIERLLYRTGPELLREYRKTVREPKADALKILAALDRNVRAPLNAC